MKFFNSKVALSCLLASVMCSPSTQAGLIKKTVESVAVVGTVTAAGTLAYGAGKNYNSSRVKDLGYGNAFKKLNSFDVPAAAATLWETVLFDFAQGFKDLASLAHKGISKSEDFVEKCNNNVNGLGKNMTDNDIQNTDSNNEISSK